MCLVWNQTVSQTCFNMQNTKKLTSDMPVYSLEVARSGVFDGFHMFLMYATSAIKHQAKRKVYHVVMCI